MQVKDRFLRYVQLETTSDESSASCPSSEKEWALARLLVEELRGMGIENAHTDANGYVYARIPENTEGQPCIGLIAHMDTSDAVLGPTHPQVLEKFTGDTVTLANGLVIDDTDTLRTLQGQDLVVTDGTSVLGADDKAGVAEIMELASILMQPDAPAHGPIAIAFTPDEEIGRGADLFDVPAFGADYAYTVDGGALGEIEYENFNAASALITIHGLSFHPGSAKNRMINAARIAAQFIQMLPDAETPEHTEGYEGFYHLIGMKGDCEEATLTWILRDHDRARFEQRKQRMQAISDYLNQVYPADTVECVLKDSYYNMREKIEPHMEIIERAQAAFTECGVQPRIEAIRGGTDGARLSFMGLPCPNLSTGGYNFHSRKEFISVQAMETMTRVLLSLVSAK